LLQFSYVVKLDNGQSGIKGIQSFDQAWSGNGRVASGTSATPPHFQAAITPSRHHALSAMLESCDIRVTDCLVQEIILPGLSKLIRRLQGIDGGKSEMTDRRSICVPELSGVEEATDESLEWVLCCSCFSIGSSPIFHMYSFAVLCNCPTFSNHQALG